MSQTHFYEVNVQWKEGRIGELSSPILEKQLNAPHHLNFLMAFQTFGHRSIYLLLQSTVAIWQPIWQ